MNIYFRRSIVLLIISSLAIDPMAAQAFVQSGARSLPSQAQNRFQDQAVTQALDLFLGPFLKKPAIQLRNWVQTLFPTLEHVFFATTVGPVLSGGFDEDIPPADVKRFHDIHVVLADDFVELLSHYRELLIDSGFFKSENVRTYTQIESAVERVQELRRSGVPDSKILVVTDLAFGLIDARTRRRDGVDLINELRLDPASPAQGFSYKLGFKGPILLVSGSMPSQNAMPDLFEQDASLYAFGYSEKGGAGDFDDHLLQGIYKTLTSPPLVAERLLEPLTKSPKFRMVSIRAEDWAAFNSFEAIIEAGILNLVRSLVVSGTSLKDAPRLIEKLYEFLHILTQVYPEPERKLHDFGNRCAVVGGYLRAVKDAVDALPPGRPQELLESRITELNNSIERAKKFAYWVQQFDSFYERQEAKTTLKDALNDAARMDRLQGKLNYNNGRRSPDETITNDFGDLEVPRPLAFVMRVILENSLDAYEESEYGTRTVPVIERWRRRPVEFTISQSRNRQGDLETHITIEDHAGGLSSHDGLYEAHKGSKPTHPGYGLFWAKYFADLLGFKVDIQNVREGAQAIITLTKHSATSIEPDDRPKPIRYIPKNDNEARLQQDAELIGGKIAGWERLDAASKDIHEMEVPAWAALPNQEGWKPFVAANSNLVERGNVIATHFHNLVDFIYETAYVSDTVGDFFGRLEAIQKQFMLEDVHDLFDEEFDLDTLKDEEGEISKQRIAQELDAYLERLVESMALPKEVALAAAQKTEEINRLVRERNESSDGKKLERSSGGDEDTFAQNNAGNLLTQEYVDKEAGTTALMLLKAKAAHAWLEKRAVLQDESFSIGFMNHRWVDAGFFAFTDLFGRMVIELNVGQPRTLASGEANATTVEFDMDEHGEVRGFYIRQGFRDLPKEIVLREGRYTRTADDLESSDALAELYQEKSRQVTDSSGQTYSCPLNVQELTLLAKTLWRAQHHRAFGYPLDMEGGYSRSSTRPVVVVQGRPIVGIKPQSYKSLPETWAGSRRHFDPGISLGHGEWKNQKVIVISADTAEADIAVVDKKYPGGYVRVQANAADQDSTGHAGVVVDPRRGSRLPHNINRLMPRIGSGQLCYLAGISLQADLRSLDYEEIAPGIRVSRESVSVVANGLSSRIFVLGAESQAVPDEKLPLIAQEKWSNVHDALDAIRANGHVDRAVFLNDNLAIVNALQDRIKFNNMNAMATSDPKEAIQELVRLGRRAVLCVDARLNGITAADVIRSAIDQGFDGFIIGYSNGDFLDTMASLASGEFSHLKVLQRQKVLWAISWDTLAEEFLDGLKTILPAPLPVLKPDAGPLIPPEYFGKVHSIFEAIKANGHVKSVVLLEDDPTLLEEQMEYAHKAGIELFAAKDSENALYALREYGREALFITDALMGQELGGEVIEKARAQGFDGFVVGYSSVHFFSPHQERDPSLVDKLAHLQKNKILWRQYRPEVNQSFWNDLASVLVPPDGHNAAQTPETAYGKETTQVHNFFEALQASGQVHSIVLLDDDMDNQKRFLHQAEINGIDLFVTGNPKEALEQLQRRGQAALFVVDARLDLPTGYIRGGSVVFDARERGFNGLVLGISADDFIFQHRGSPVQESPMSRNLKTLADQKILWTFNSSVEMQDAFWKDLASVLAKPPTTETKSVVSTKKPKARNFLEAIQADGRADSIVFLHDEHGVRDEMKKDAEEHGIPVFVTRWPAEALEKLRSWGRRALFVVDAHLEVRGEGEILGGSVIHDARRQGFDGLIIGASAGNFINAHRGLPDIQKELLQLEAEQILWPENIGIFFMHFDDLAAVLKLPATSPPVAVVQNAVKTVKHANTLLEALQAEGQVDSIVFLHDEPFFLEDMTDRAKQFGFQAIATRDPEEALASLKSLGRRALFVVDAHLDGGIMGGEVIQQARQNGFEGVIVGVSALDFIEEHDNVTTIENELRRLKEAKVLWPMDINEFFSELKNIAAVLRLSAQTKKPTLAVKPLIPPEALSGIYTLFDALQASGQVDSIVYLNDEISMVLAWQVILENAGINGLATTRVEEALDKLKELGSRALFFVDAFLGNTTGTEVIQEAWRQGFDGFIVGYSTIGFMLALDHVGPEEVIRKLKQLDHAKLFWDVSGYMTGKSFYEDLAAALVKPVEEFPAPTESPKVSLTTYPMREVYSLEEAIEANGLPKKVVLYGHEDLQERIRGFYERAGVDVYSADTEEQAMAEAIEWGDQCILVVHGFRPGNIQRMLTNPDFKGIFIYVSNGAREIEKIRALFEQAGSQYKGRWWTMTLGEWLALDAPIAAFNQRASAQMATPSVVMQPKNSPVLDQPSLSAHPISEARSFEEAWQAHVLPKKGLFFFENRLRAGSMYAEEWNDAGIESIHVNSWDALVSQAIEWGEQSLVLLHGILAEDIEALLVNPLFRGIIVFFSNGIENLEDMDSHLSGLGNSYKGRWWTYQDDSDLIAKWADHLSSFNQQADMSLPQNRSIPTEIAPESLGQKNAQWSNAIEAAIRDEFQQIPLTRLGRGPYDMAFHLLMTKLELMTPFSWDQQNQLDHLTDAFVYEKFPSDRSFWESEPDPGTLDRDLAEQLIEAQQEFSYPYYPSADDSRVIQLMNYFAAVARKQLVPMVSAQKAITPAVPLDKPVIVAVDDERSQISTLESAAKGIKDVQFFGFGQKTGAADRAKEMLKKKPVSLLVMDVFFNGSNRGEELLQTAIQTAEAAGTSFDVLVVSGVGRDSKYMNSLQALQDAHPGTVRSLDYATRDDGAEKMMRLFSTDRNSRRGSSPLLFIGLSAAILAGIIISVFGAPVIYALALLLPVVIGTVLQRNDSENLSPEEALRQLYQIKTYYDLEASAQEIPDWKRIAALVTALEFGAYLEPQRVADILIWTLRLKLHESYEAAARESLQKAVVNVLSSLDYSETLKPVWIEALTGVLFSSPDPMINAFKKFAKIPEAQIALGEQIPAALQYPWIGKGSEKARAKIQDALLEIQTAYTNQTLAEFGWRALMGEGAETPPDLIANVLRVYGYFPRANRTLLSYEIRRLLSDPSILENKTAQETIHETALQILAYYLDKDNSLDSNLTDAWLAVLGKYENVKVADWQKRKALEILEKNKPALRDLNEIQERMVFGHPKPPVEHQENVSTAVVQEFERWLKSLEKVLQRDVSCLIEAVVKNDFHELTKEGPDNLGRKEINHYVRMAMIDKVAAIQIQEFPVEDPDARSLFVDAFQNHEGKPQVLVLNEVIFSLAERQIGESDPHLLTRYMYAWKILDEQVEKMRTPVAMPAPASVPTESSKPDITRPVSISDAFMYLMELQKIKFKELRELEKIAVWSEAEETWVTRQISILATQITSGLARGYNQSSGRTLQIEFVLGRSA